MGDANDAITNHGTILNIQAILSRMKRNFIYNNKQTIQFRLPFYQ